MKENYLRSTGSSLFIAGFFVCLLLMWFSGSLTTSPYDLPDGVPLFIGGVPTAPYSFIFAFLYGLIPLYGGIIGLQKSRKWGMFGSKMGKAVFFLSLGLFTWGFGELIWSYYNFFLNQDIPYPSLADASFILSWPLWGIGTFYLSHATGVKYGLKKISGRFQLVILPIIAAAISYYLLVVVARGGSFTFEGGFAKVFFDLAYPIGDVVILTMAFLVYGLSFQYLGGRFKFPVLVLLSGFVVNYMADFGFSYTTTTGSFYNGSWVDLLFATAVFLLSFAINSFDVPDSPSALTTQK